MKITTLLWVWVLVAVVLIALGATLVAQTPAAKPGATQGMPLVPEASDFWAVKLQQGGGSVGPDQVVEYDARAADDDDLLVPLVPPPSLARWGEVPAWEGTFRAVWHARQVNKSGSTVRTEDEIVDGTVFLDNQTNLGFPNIPRGQGGPRASIWEGRAKASVRIQSLEIHKTKNGQVSHRDEGNGEGPAEAECDLQIDAARGAFILHVRQLRIDMRHTHWQAGGPHDPPTSSSSVGTDSVELSGAGLQGINGGALLGPGNLPVSGLLLNQTATYNFTSNDGRVCTETCSYTLRSVGQPLGVDLVADPGGPYTPLRGTTVTLDGSRSRPSKGRQIRSYKWKLTPTGCPDLGTPTELTGQRVTFKVLCAVRAELTVDDGAETATKGVEVTVTARPWKTKLTTDPALDLKNFGFEPGNFALGMNRCQRHSDPNENHYYHPRAGSMVDYETGTFWLERVADNGPFRGIWFVAKGEFGMPRVLMINQKLYPGGTVYQANAAKGPKQKNMIDRLRRSVELHESLHSTLLERAVKATADPAKAVEGGMAKDREALKKQMNFILRDAFTRLNKATAEDKVKAEMRKVPEFRAGGRIYYPASGNVRAGYLNFPSFAELGDK